MSEKFIPTPPTKARARVAWLASRGVLATDAEKVDAYGTLLCSQIDRDIRRNVAAANGSAPGAVALNEVQVAHLVGLLLAEAGVPGSSVTLVEGIVREAVAAAQTVAE